MPAGHVNHIAIKFAFFRVCHNGACCVGVCVPRLRGSQELKDTRTATQSFLWQLVTKSIFIHSTYQLCLGKPTWSTQHPCEWKLSAFLEIVRTRAVSGQVFGALSVKILVFPSPTGCMLCHLLVFLFIDVSYYFIDASKMMDSFPWGIWTSTNYFSNSTAASATSGRFSRFIGVRVAAPQWFTIP